MDRILFSILFLLLAGIAEAQTARKFSVVSFGHDPFDLTAKSDAHKKVDGNGSLYAIIKVTSATPDDQLVAYRFNFGNMNHEVVQRDGELWVYVQRNAKMVTISRQGFASVSRYDLGLTIEEGNTYTMQLSPEAARVYTQMVQFSVQPADAKAVVTIKSSKEGASKEFFGVIDAVTGSVAKNCPLGTYTYEVVADNFYPTEGRFTLNNQQETHVEKIILRSNFGTIALQTNADADIYVDGEERGHGAWTGPLRAGTHLVECRQLNHRSTTQTIVVEENENRTIVLDSPVPITGTLSVLSQPLGASISIDGKDYGVTPRNINDILIGQHTVKLSLANYKEENKAVEVKENEMTNIELKLNDIAWMTINSNPEGAMLYIDGEKIGLTPVTREMTSGNYNVRLTRKEYKDYTGLVHLDISQHEVTLPLTPPYQRSKCIYAAPYLQFGHLSTIGINAGMYWRNINAELFAAMGLDSQDYYAYSINRGSYDTEYSLEVDGSMRAYQIGLRLGYGFRFGFNWRVTPQIGLSTLAARGGDVSFNTNGMTIGCKIDYSFNKRFGVSLTPEYMMQTDHHDYYSGVDDLLPKLDSWREGFSFRIGFYRIF